MLQTSHHQKFLSLIVQSYKSFTKNAKSMLTTLIKRANEYYENTVFRMIREKD